MCRTDAAPLVSRLDELRRRCALAVTARQAVDADPGDRFRGLYISDAQADALAAGERPPAIDAPDPDVTYSARIAALDLDSLDLELLVVALAPDLDPSFERLYGYLHDDVTRRRASVGLALELAGATPTSAEARARLTAGSPLMARHLLVLEDADRPFLTRALRVPDRVTAHLLGDDRADPVLEPFRRSAEPVGAAGRDLGALARAIVDGPVLVHLCDDRYGSGVSYAAALLQHAGQGAVAIDVAAIPDERLLEMAGAVVREGVVTRSGLVLLGLDALASRPGGASIARAFADAPVTVVVVGGLTWDPAWSGRVPLSLQTPALPVDDDLRPFRLTPDGAARARFAAALSARSAGQAVNRAHLAAGARSQNGSGLERLANRIAPTAHWEDLVLPLIARTQLQELVARVRHRPTVLDRWSMGGRATRGHGVTALFSGESGTGKTMSAEIIGGELGLDLYVVDLATVVDKYIGETEKNLDRIFNEADRVNGVLLFDEADAIFGKRSEVSDARDRYANVEVAYLLQRMERFDGIAILTTNLRANLDDAFLRRLDVLVDFPSPDVDARRCLWNIHLPASLPTTDDLDLDFLASAFELTGGSIRNITLTAAFLAADADQPVGMAELVRATEREYRKLGRLCLEVEFGRYHELVGAAVDAR